MKLKSSPYVYIRYHTITDVYTTALLLTKPSSDDDSGLRHGFGAEASLPLNQSAPAVSHDTARLFVLERTHIQNMFESRSFPTYFASVGCS